MNLSPDILKKTAIVLTVAVVMGMGGYFIRSMTGEQPPPQVSLMEKVKPERVIRKITLTDVAPQQKRYVNDQVAIEAIIACKRANMAIQDCVKAQNIKYEATAAVPASPADDGFEGYIMFPLSGDRQIIMDYNRRVTQSPMIYYGSFSDLQDAVRNGGMGQTIHRRVNSVEQIIK